MVQKGRTVARLTETLQRQNIGIYQVDDGVLSIIDGLTNYDLLKTWFFVSCDGILYFSL